MDEANASRLGRQLGRLREVLSWCVRDRGLDVQRNADESVRVALPPD